MHHRPQQLEIRLQVAGTDLLDHVPDGVNDGRQRLVLILNDAKGFHCLLPCLDIGMASTGPRPARHNHVASIS